MEVAGSAVGIASLGIQVCQGLLSYYNSWKSYKTDISTAYDCVADLHKTFKLLEESLDSDRLDLARTERVSRCLDSCVSSLEKLRKKLQKLQTYTLPNGFLQKTWSELQRSFYPFKESNLVKLRELVHDLQSHLSLALQVLQLDLSADSHHTVAEIAIPTRDTAADVRSLLKAQQAEQFQKIVDWLSPADSWTNHNSARRRHVPQTGCWLLQSSQYKKWKTGQIDHLWLHGKPGCGKTVLCSTVVEDIRAYCGSAINTGFAIFYFTFSDNHKQSYESLLLSLVAQLGWREPAQSTLRQMYDNPNRILPSSETLEGLLLSSINQHDVVFLLLDALDECPEANEARKDMLGCLQRLARGAQTLKIFSTSRELLDIQASLKSLGVETLSIDTKAVDVDIGSFVRGELSSDRKLMRLDERTKTMIEETLIQKADGMFRWAFCQLHELKRLKSSKPKRFQDALQSLPSTLDETYDRMLLQIEDVDRTDALVALQWLAFGEGRLTLGEIAEALIVDPSGDGNVDFENRGGIEDVLEILAGLVVVVKNSNNGTNKKVKTSSHQPINSHDGNDLSRRSSINICKTDILRLAHFSVKEYLASERILKTEAKGFHLEEGQGHYFLAQSCLTYLIQYSRSRAKTSTYKDSRIFPLLRYSNNSWFYHCKLQRPSGTARELEFLGSNACRKDWLKAYDPEKKPGLSSLFCISGKFGSSLYYASFLGLSALVNQLLKDGADVNARGGTYETALQAALAGGHQQIAEMLIAEGADVNAQGGVCGNPLQAASAYGHKEIVKLLIMKGANFSTQEGRYDSALIAALSNNFEEITEILIKGIVNVNAAKPCGGSYGNTLQVASRSGNKAAVEMLIAGGANVNALNESRGCALHAALEQRHEDIAKMLITKGADINAHTKRYGTTLQAASAGGSKEMVELLIADGADVHAQGGRWGNSLQAASQKGYIEIVRLLIDEGADINAQSGYYSNALQAASASGCKETVELLIANGANVHAQGGHLGNALQAASVNGYIEIVKLLIDEGADPNAQGGYYNNALFAASRQGYKEIATLLIAQGVDVNGLKEGNSKCSSLQEASVYGHKGMVEILIKNGANVNAQDGDYGTALHAALIHGHKEIATMLIARGANVNAQGVEHGTALQLASRKGYKKLVSMLIAAGADINAQGGEFGNAIYTALAHGYTEIAEMLLAKGADVNPWGGFDADALYEASRRGHSESVEMLIAKGTDINAYKQDKGDALQVAVATGNREVAEILVAKGINVNAQGGKYGSALHAASQQGWVDMAELLIINGANVNAQGGANGSPLQLASYFGQEVMAEMLIEKGADTNAQGGKYGSALQAALAGGHTELAQMLIDRGASVDVS